MDFKEFRRGKRIVCDDWAYGDLKHEYGNETWIDDCEVDPDSVEQLVGFDDAGNEVYENAILTDDECNEYQARLIGILEDAQGFYKLNVVCNRRRFFIKTAQLYGDKNLTLKGASNNG